MTHLTDEQLTDYLSGTSLPAIDDHVATCGVCRREIVLMRASFKVFDHASMEWSERVQNAAGSEAWSASRCAILELGNRLGGRVRSCDRSGPAIQRSSPAGRDFAVRRCEQPPNCGQQRQRHSGT